MARRVFLGLVLGALTTIGAFLAARWLGGRDDAPNSRASWAHTPKDARAEDVSKGYRARTNVALALSTATIAHGRADGGADREPGDLEGRVVSSVTLRGIADAEVTFASAGGATSVVTGADGSFRFETDQDGRCVIAFVAAAGFLPFAPEWGQSPLSFTVRRGTSVRGVTIALDPAVEYLGVVLDPDGRRVEGAVIRLLDLVTGTLALAPVADRFRSNEKGEFVFSAPDETLIEATHAGFASARARVDLETRSRRRITLRLGRLDAADDLAAGVIDGWVIDGNGAGVEGAVVTAEMHRLRRGSSRRRLDSPRKTLSDTEGRFVLTGLESGTFRVVASINGVPRAEKQEIPETAHDVRLEIVAGGELMGRVSDRETGAPIGAFTLNVSEVHGALWRSPVVSAPFIDAGGEYRIDGLMPGDYEARVAAEGFAPSDPVRFSIAGDMRERETANFAVARGACFDGIVVSERDGRPLAEARVSMEGQEMSGGSPIRVHASVLTDHAGLFHLCGFATGPQSLEVMATDHHPRIVSGLGGSARAMGERITVELAPTRSGEEPRLELVGIGAVLAVGDGALVIGDVLPGGGAALALLSSGDVIVRVDGEDVSGLGLDGSVQRIRGVEGTSVQLTVRKSATGEVVELAVMRRRIRT